MNKDTKPRRGLRAEAGIFYEDSIDVKEKNFMSKCSCYHTRKQQVYGHTGFGPYCREETVGECWGTKERDQCSCNGNTIKCDFYPEKRNTKVFAVDFDGTLCDNVWPEIGEPNIVMIEYVKALRQLGHKLILWTCREGDNLNEAVSGCSEQGVTFDAINDNLEEHKELFGGNSRKIVADYYIDDKAVQALSALPL